MNVIFRLPPPNAERALQWQLSNAAAVQEPVPLPWLDIPLIALPILASLFNAQIGKLTPLTMAASLGLMGWLRWPRVVPVIARCWPVLGLAILALASVLWSIHPAATMRYGLLYVVTAALGVGIAGLVSSRNLVWGLFLAFGLFNLVSYAFGHYVPMGVGGIAYAGITPSKNMAAQVAGFGVLSAFAAAVLAVSERRMMVLAATVPVLLVCVKVLIMARSTGALVATFVAFGAMAVFLISRLFPLRGRILTALGSVPVLLAVTLFANAWFPTIFDLVLKEGNKDAGLTGRAELWARADALIAARPLFGLGYGAFWVKGNPEAEDLWREFGIASQTGFHFHNTPREILVHLGYFGLTVFAIVAVIGILRLIVRQILIADDGALLMMGFAIFSGAALPFELVGFGTMHFASVLTLSCIAYGYLSFDGRPYLRQFGTPIANRDRSPVRMSRSSR